ncbi:MAG: sugar phosphate isomerase/epimerase family protein [Planctomycetota bacterium]
MKVSFTTLGCPDWTLEQIAQNAKAYGYDGVELRTHTDGNHFSPDASVEEAKRVGQLFRDTGVPVVSVMGYCSFAFTDDAQVAKNQELMRKLLVIAEAMEAPFVRTFAGRIPDGANQDEMVLKVAHALKPLAAEAAKRKVRIGLETHDDWCAGDRVLKLARSVKNMDGFGIVYDIYNAFSSGIEPWNVTYRKVRPHICYCHLKDGYKGLDGKEHLVMLGAGAMPVERMLKRFRKDGYEGYFSFEWEKKWHPELEPAERTFPQFSQKVKALWGA